MLLISGIGVLLFLALYAWRVSQKRYCLERIANEFQPRWKTAAERYVSIVKSLKSGKLILRKKDYSWWVDLSLDSIRSQIEQVYNIMEPNKKSLKIVEIELSNIEKNLELVEGDLMPQEIENYNKYFNWN